jgi:hypothetical protein
MDQPKRQTRLTPEEQKLKERLMRSGPPPRRKGSGKISEEFWKLPRPEDPEGRALKGLLEDREHGR